MLVNKPGIPKSTGALRISAPVVWPDPLASTRSRCRFRLGEIHHENAGHETQRMVDLWSKPSCTLTGKIDIWVNRLVNGWSILYTTCSWHQRGPLHSRLSSWIKWPCKWKAPIEAFARNETYLETKQTWRGVMQVSIQCNMYTAIWRRHTCHRVIMFPRVFPHVSIFPPVFVLTFLIVFVFCPMRITNVCLSTSYA